MSPATTSANAYDPATGAARAYDHWVPERVAITRVASGRSSFDVTLRRCRVLNNGDTETLTDDVAAALGVSATIGVSVADVYTPTSDGTYPVEVAQMVGAVQVPLVQTIAALMTARGVR